MLFDTKQLMADFHSGEIETQELKKIISEAVVEAHPGETVSDIQITDDGLVEVTLSNGNKVEIEIDWNEIILR